MNPCDRCKRPMDLKCCHNCKKDAADCKVWHNCGEDCKEWEAQIQTNADRIRAMSDEELARMLMMAHDGEIYIPFCKNKDECFYALDHNKDIKDSECLRCMIDLLKQPVTEVDHE